jgi:hypothetical protein
MYEDKGINFLDLPITRNTDNLNTNKFRKPTPKDTLYFTSNHPTEHKHAA